MVRLPDEPDGTRVWRTPRGEATRADRRGLSWTRRRRWPRRGLDERGLAWEEVASLGATSRGVHAAQRWPMPWEDPARLPGVPREDAQLLEVMRRGATRHRPSRGEGSRRPGDAT